MTAPSRPAAGGAYIRKSDGGELILVERTREASAAPTIIGIDPGHENLTGQIEPDAEVTASENIAPRGRKKGR